MRFADRHQANARQLIRRRLARTGAVGVLVLASLTSFAVTSPPSHASTTIKVTTTSQTPTATQCSLQDAVVFADGGSEPACSTGTASGVTTIDVPGGRYVLTETLAITGDAKIEGSSTTTPTTISGNNAVQVINIAGGVTVTLDHLTITDGVSGVPGCATVVCPAVNGYDGGGIANAGNLTLIHSVVTGNHASDGLSQRTLPCLKCARSGLSGGAGGSGGGIDNSGVLTIKDSTISKNGAGNGTNATDGFSSSASAGQDGGDGGNGGQGGGIDNEFSATTTIIDSTISDNTSGNGGNAGGGSTATISGDGGGDAGSAGEGGTGAGIENVGILTVNASTISGNTTGHGGDGGTAGLGDGGGAAGTSTQSGIGGAGGGLSADSPESTTLTDSTIADNTASVGGASPTAGSGGIGGAVFNESGGAVSLNNVTIARNTAAGKGGAVASVDGPIDEAATVIAANTSTPAASCDGVIVDEGHNVSFDDATCPGARGNPKLGPLASNGGLTKTIAIGAGSAAIGRVPHASCLAADQRGLPKPVHGACDAGAYERTLPAISKLATHKVSANSATVTAHVNPELTAKSTTVKMRYGRHRSLGSTTASQSIGKGDRPKTVTFHLRHLTPRTTYRLEVVAKNGDGTTTSSTITFTTKRA